MLRAIGLKRKLRLRSWWAKPVLSLLYAMRAVRGTKLDIFGYDEVRRAERELVADYERSVDRAIINLSPATARNVLELVALPEWIRGYEQIKLHSLETYRARRTDLLAQIQNQVSSANAG
jgi:indolepyruvate ferredoxin oxidoreductase